MKERINELIKSVPDLKYDSSTGTFETDRRALYDFAELIIKECVKVVDGMADPEDSERYFWAIQNASQKIKRHFGVEE